MKEISKVSQAPKHKVNPFLDQDEVIRVNSGKKKAIIGQSKSHAIANLDTGEISGSMVMMEERTVDKEQFVKLFTSEIRALFDLSKSGIKVFGYIVENLKPGDDKIYIYLPHLMEYCNYKAKNRAYVGLGELVKSNILAASEMPNFWYVNPKIVFNGDRIAFIKAYRIKEKKYKQLNID